jgi:dihydrodiol dehydrogenase / D-xylose 1-dehydrogenase (NADP)
MLISYTSQRLIPTIIRMSSYTLIQGKMSCVKKAFTVNAAQAKELVQIAQEKNLFLMEGLWTRYFPLSIYVRDAIISEKLGIIISAFADNSLDLKPEENFDVEHRMVNPDLAGGVLLGVGIYSLTWIFQTLYTTQSFESRVAPRVLSSVQKYGPTGVDERRQSLSLSREMLSLEVICMALQLLASKSLTT